MLAARDDLIDGPARTIVVVSHVTPIKVLLGDAVGSGLEISFRIEVAPASISVISYFEGPDDVRRALVRSANTRPLPPALAGFGG